MKSQRKRKEEYGSIYARIRSNGGNKKYVLGLTIKETEWLKYKSLKYTSSALMASIGIRYGQFVNILTQIKHALEEDFDPNTAPSVIHSIIFSSLNDTDVEAPEQLKPSGILLRDYMETYIEELRRGERTKRRQSSPVSQGHCNNLHSALTCLRDFETLVKKRFTLEDITMDFQRKFIKFLRDRGLKQNTINSRLGSIRTTMQIAYFEKKTTSIDFQHPDFVPAKEQVDEIYLTPKQINQMMDLDLSSVESLKALVKKAKFDKERKKNLPLLQTRFLNNLRKVRDIFMVGCLTGQRLSDYKRINDSMIVSINEKQFIKLRQVKTGKDVMIPYDARAKSILEKYNGELPKVARHTFNSHLHFLGEILGWTEDAIFMHGENTEHKRVCDLLTSHTARRTFATNAYAAGVPLASILAVTGHSSERNLRTYLRLNSMEKAIIAAEDFKDFIQQ